MKKILACRIVVLCLLLIIQNDNMKSNASKISMVRKQAYRLFFVFCCERHCKKGDKCVRVLEKKSMGCKCFRRDRRYNAGGYWKTYEFKN